MYQIKVTIEGASRILINRLTEEQKAKIDKRETGGTRTVKESEDEALGLAYRNKNGLYLPGGNIKKCLLNGITRGNIKEGKASARPYVEATVFIEPDEVEFGVDKPDFIHECMGRRPPKTGGRCVIRRPGLHEGWHLSFTMMVVDDRRNSDSLRRGMEEAGLLVGLCDWRPEFGRFIVKKWEVKKSEK